MTSVLILPGLGDSGPGHWQTIWETRNPGFRRVVQRGWDAPDLGEWVETLEDAVQAAEPPVTLVAHSLACALVAHWAQRGSRERVSAALLVSPSDVDSPAYTPPEVRGFAPIPLAALPFPAIVVASSSDPYVSSERARAFAQSWGARFVDAGEQGHINTASGHGEWDEGYRHLVALLGDAEAASSVSGESRRRG